MATRRKIATIRALPSTSGTCPYCRVGMMQLQTTDAKGAPRRYSCDNSACGYRMLAEPAAALSFEARRRALAERAAKAHRRSMAAIARADRLKRVSRRIRATRPSHRKK